MTTKKLKQVLYHSSHIWKTALSAGVAWEVAQWTQTSRPYFAPLAAILCTQTTVADSLTRGYERLLGIVGGIIVAELTAKLIGVTAWSVALIVLIGTGLAALFRFGRQATPQVGVSAMMVLTLGVGLHHYAFDRIAETAIGALVAIVVNMFILPTDRSVEAEIALVNAAEHLSKRFSAVAEWLASGAPKSEGDKLREPTRAFVLELHSASVQVELALNALRYSPLVYRRRASLLHLQSQLLHLRQGYAHLTGMVRTLLEWNLSGTLSREQRHLWQERFESLGLLIDTWKSVSLLGKHEQNKEFAPHHDLSDLNHEIFTAALYNDARQMEEDFKLTEVQE